MLGGLFTFTALTLLVIPALYSQLGKQLMPKPKTNIVSEQEPIRVDLR